MRQVYYCVQWCGSAPLSHPAFKKAYQVEPTVYRLEFPVEVPGILRNKAVQRHWAEDRVRHLASWGIQAHIFDMPGQNAGRVTCRGVVLSR
ncbi:MAG: hypothetical protein AMXMBFR13_06980 [Phycisphaerae bacterium]